MLHFGKIPKKFGQIWRKLKIQQNSGKNCEFFVKNQEKIQQIITNILRLENGDNFWKHFILKLMSTIYSMKIVAWKCGEERTDYARAVHAVSLNVSVFLPEELVWYLPV